MLVAIGNADNSNPQADVGVYVVYVNCNGVTYGGFVIDEYNPTITFKNDYIKIDTSRDYIIIDTTNNEYRMFYMGFELEGEEV